MARILDSVKGHESVVERLVKARTSKRLAPVMLFAGPSGVGKKRVALGLSQALICEVSPLACGTCSSCLRIEKGNTESFLLISPSSQQLRVEEAKEVHHFLSLQKIGSARAIVIDQAHLMNSTAANSLLKILEEPPEDSYFFLITQNASDILSTIRSRSQTVQFGPLSREILKNILMKSKSDWGDSDEWSLDFVEGRADLLEALQTEEAKSLFDASLKILQIAPTKDRLQAYDLLKSAAENRESSLMVCQVWQRCLRQVYRQKLEGATSLPVRLEKLRSYLKLDNDRLDILMQKTFAVERAIRSNSDLLLVFEDCWETFAEATHGLD